ncbi:MAG TPA: hypothetical protein VIN35_11860 [Hydrogenophaga sp.]
MSAETCFRGDPELPRWEERCKVDFGQFLMRSESLAVSHDQLNWRVEEIEMRWQRMRGYSGQHQRLGDYYVREVERTGTEHRQVVHFEVVGTGRIEKMPRSRFDRQVRPA